MEFKITSTTFGTPKVGDTVFSYWDFTPKCGTGACDVSTNASDPVLNGTLHRTGSRYQGALHGPVQGCGAGDVQLTQTIDLRVTTAEFVEGIWKVTAITRSGVMPRPPPVAVPRATTDGSSRAPRDERRRR